MLHRIVAEVPDRPVVVRLPASHSMGSSLASYVEARVHEAIDQLTPSAIYVRGSHDRSRLVSVKEKRDKCENWQRPTAEVRGRELVLHCFPGEAHVFHHASLVATHLSLTGRDPGIVQMELPVEGACTASLRQGLQGLQATEVAVVAAGNEHLAGGSAWVDHPGAKSRVEVIGGPSVTWLAVKHSFWGDIVEHLGRLLVETGYGAVFFVGKLGSLRADHRPNELLVTGSESTVGNEEVSWDNPFEPLGGEIVVGRHVTLPSVLQETAQWAKLASGSFDFVDPEIGHFARGVTYSGGRFGYLHMVSDNVVARYRHDLSNEREREVRDRRRTLYGTIRQTLEATIPRVSAEAS